MHTLFPASSWASSTNIWCLKQLTLPNNQLWDIVAARDAITLLPIINNHEVSGTIVHSNEWPAYNRVASLPNANSCSSVNHSTTFVDPITDTHTQHIESYWNRVKIKLKHMRGCHENQIASYLDEFMYRVRYGNTAREAFNNILSDIADQYPV